MLSNQRSTWHFAIFMDSVIHSCIHSFIKHGDSCIYTTMHEKCSSGFSWNRARAGFPCLEALGKLTEVSYEQSQKMPILGDYFVSGFPLLASQCHLEPIPNIFIQLRHFSSPTTCPPLYWFLFSHICLSFTWYLSCSFFVYLDILEKSFLNWTLMRYKNSLIVSSLCKVKNPV